MRRPRYGLATTSGLMQSEIWPEFHRGPNANQQSICGGESMEKPIGFWLRTEGIAGSDIPTIDSRSRLNEPGARVRFSPCDLLAERECKGTLMKRGFANLFAKKCKKKCIFVDFQAKNSEFLERSVLFSSTLRI